MAVKTRRKNGGGMMGFRFMDTGSLPTLIGPASLFEGHVTQTAEDLNSRFMYWRTPKNSTAPCKWQIWNSSTGGNPSEEDEEVEGRRESTHFMVSVKLAKEA
ncbi:unnamed protein product [Sphagnum troendelagicum]